MNIKTILCLALALNGVLCGCSTVKEHPTTISSAAAGAKTLILDVQMLDVKNGWALAQRGQDLDFHTLLLHTINGGESWRDCTPLAASNNIDIEFYFFDTRHGWVFVWDRKKADDYLLLTTDGGKSWMHVIPPFHYSEGSGCHFFNPNHGIASEEEGGLGSAYVRYFETYDGGKNWKPIIIVPPDGPNDPPGTIHLCSLCGDRISYAPPAEVIIAHGDMGDEGPKDAVRLSLTTNSGKSWRELKLPLPSEKYRDCLVTCEPPIFLNARQGWLPAYVTKWNTNDTRAWDAMIFYTTDDGGQTWAPRPGCIEGGTNFLGGTRQFDIVSAKDMFVHNGANLYVTHDRAKSWQIIKPNVDFNRTSSNGGVAEIDFVDTKHGWSVVYDTFKQAPWDKYYLYKTSNGGATWTELPLKIEP